MTRHLVLLIATLGLVGCSKKDGPATPVAAAPASPPAAFTDAGAAATATSNAAPVIDTAAIEAPKEVLPGVLPIVAESPSPEAREKARGLNVAGLKLHRKKKFDEAMAQYKEALTADPSEPFARYNLACALVSANKPQDALKLLGEFRELGCAQCWDRLRRARQDVEWKPLWSNETFKQLTAESGIAPTAKVVSFHVGVADDDTDQPKNFAVNVVLEPPPGWVKAPALEIAITRKGKTLHLRKLKSADIEDAWVLTEFPIPKGPWQVTLLVEGKKLGSIKAKRDQIGIEVVPEPLIRKVRRPKSVGRCDGVECPKFPALSADGKYLVDRVFSHLVSTSDMCGPPAADLTNHLSLSGDEPTLIGSRNLAGYRSLECQQFGHETMKLSHGATANYNEEDETVTVTTKSGKKKVHDLAAEHIREYCVVEEHRLLVLVQYYQGTDCSDPTEDAITAVHY